MSFSQPERARHSSQPTARAPILASRGRPFPVFATRRLLHQRARAHPRNQEATFLFALKGGRLIATMGARDFASQSGAHLWRALFIRDQGASDAIRTEGALWLR